MAINQCLLCDKDFNASNNMSKWCKECREKQKEIRLQKSKQKKYTILPQMRYKVVEKVCDNCKKTFLPTKGGMAQLLRRFCSHSCQIKWQREFDSDFVKRKIRRRTASSASIFESDPEEYLETIERE